MSKTYRRLGASFFLNTDWNNLSSTWKEYFRKVGVRICRVGEDLPDEKFLKGYARVFHSDNFHATKSFYLKHGRRVSKQKGKMKNKMDLIRCLKLGYEEEFVDTPISKNLSY